MYPTQGPQHFHHTKPYTEPSKPCPWPTESGQQLESGCFKTQYCTVIVNTKYMEVILLLPIFLFSNSSFLWYVRINSGAVIILLKGFRKEGQLKDSQRPILTCHVNFIKQWRGLSIRTTSTPGSCHWVCAVDGYLISCKVKYRSVTVQLTPK